MRELREYIYCDFCGVESTSEALLRMEEEKYLPAYENYAKFTAINSKDWCGECDPRKPSE